MDTAAARADGLIGSDLPLVLPFMAPRLQGEITADGRLEIEVWGAGRLGRVRFSPIAGPYVFAPNRLTAPGAGAFVAQSAPALAIRGARLLAVESEGLDGSAAPGVSGGDRRAVWSEGGGLIAEQRGRDILVAAGSDAAEADAGLALAADEVVRQAAAYASRCDLLPAADALLRSMAVQAAHAALSSVRRDARCGFAGLTAGAIYSAPARSYYRDAYWTAQTLWRLEPAAVAGEIDLLASGVRADGAAPSGLVFPGGDDFWSDHFDSPLLFVLMLSDYVRESGDAELARRHWRKVQSVLARYLALAQAGQGLPRKPRNDRDWADNVYREGHVAYDVGLYVGAMDAIARMGAEHDPSAAEAAARGAVAARATINTALWADHGWYADYVTPDGFWEDHLTLDSLTLLRFDAVAPVDALAVLAAMRRRLESRRNADQPFGDWGVMCAFPPYRRPNDLRAKAADAFRYHNGGDWPWLDGLYAGERLRRGLSGWRYPLLRWWRACLEQGWIGAIEHFSPPYGRGSLLQAWSSLPLAAVLDHPEAVLAGDPDEP
jgi:hypothetical protein